MVVTGDISLTGEVSLVLEVEMVTGGGRCVERRLVEGGGVSLLRGDNSPAVR